MSLGWKARPTDYIQTTLDDFTAADEIWTPSCHVVSDLRHFFHRTMFAGGEKVIELVNDRH